MQRCRQIRISHKTGAESKQTGAESAQTGAESAQRMIRVEAMIDSFFTNAIRSDARRNMVATLDCLMRHPEYSAAKVAKELGLSQSAIPCARPAPGGKVVVF